MSDRANIPGLDALPEAAAIALRDSRTTCHPDCADYHGVWTMLRLFGNLPSVAFDHDFLLAALDEAVSNRAFRVLISGAADFGLLAYVHAAFARATAPLQVSIVDRCGTPLAVNRWYAQRAGIDATTETADILAYRSDPFDVIVAHNFLNFFSPQDRIRLVRHWKGLLRSGGRIISVSTVKSGASLRSRRFDQDEAEDLATGMIRAKNASIHDNMISDEALRSLVIGYAKSRVSWNIRDETEMSAPFFKAGFRARVMRSGVPAWMAPAMRVGRVRCGLVAEA